MRFGVTSSLAVFAHGGVHGGGQGSFSDRSLRLGGLIGGVAGGDFFRGAAGGVGGLTGGSQIAIPSTGDK